MRILIFGAGVNGSALATFLANGGVDVTILARGQRYEEIKQNGIIVVDSQTSEQIEVRIPVITMEEYSQNPTTFDFIIAILRHNQVAEALPILDKISPPAPIFFLGNNCSGFEEYVSGVGRERVIFGTPNAGGIRENGTVTYISPNYGKKIPIHVGEIDGSITPRLREFQAILKIAGIHVKFESNIDALLKVHVASVLPGADAIYRANGDLHKLAANKSQLKLIARAMKENIRVLRTLGIPSGGNEGPLRWIPSSLLVFAMRKLFKTQMGEIGMKGHAMAGRDEMDDLEKEFRKLIAQSQVPTPAFDALSVESEYKTLTN